MLKRKQLLPPLSFKITDLWDKKISDEVKTKLSERQQRIKEKRDDQVEARRSTS
jgi:hypothetical protein